MKRRIIAGFLLILVGGLFSVTADAENLLKNGDFEEGRTGWGFYDREKASSTVVSDEKHSGKFCNRIVCFEPGYHATYQLFERETALEPGFYTISYWMKTDLSEKFEGAAALAVGAKNANKENVGLVRSQAESARGTTPWTKYTINFEVSKEAVRVEIHPIIHRTIGTAWFDDIVLEKKPEVVLEFHFDEGSGKIAKDSSGNGCDGTIHGNPSWVEGKKSSALRFNGRNNYVYCSFIGSPIRTIELWFKLVEDVSKGVLFDPMCLWALVEGKSGTWGNMCLKADGKLHTWIRKLDGNNNHLIDAVVSKTDKWEKGNWYYVRFTSDAYGINLYVNGVLESSTSHSRCREIAMTDLAVGVDHWGKPVGATYFDGVIDEIRCSTLPITLEKEYY